MLSDFSHLRRSAGLTRSHIRAVGIWFCALFFLGMGQQIVDFYVRLKDRQTLEVSWNHAMAGIVKQQSCQ